MTRGQDGGIHEILDGVEFIGDADIYGNDDNVEKRFNGGDVDGGKLSEVALTVEEIEEKKEEELSAIKRDPAQFFTQIGTLVSVSGITVEMTISIISDIIALNVNAIILKGLVLGLIYIPTLSALLIAICKDNVKSAVRGAIFVSKMIAQKTKSRSKREAQNLAKNLKPNSIVSRLQNKGKENQLPPPDDKDKAYDNETDVYFEMEPNLDHEDHHFKDVANASTSNAGERQSNFSGGDRDSLAFSSSSERTITPSDGNIGINDHFELENVPDRQERRNIHYYTEEEQFDNSSLASRESYQSFMTTQRLETKKPNQIFHNNFRDDETERSAYDDYHNGDISYASDSGSVSVSEYSSPNYYNQRNLSPSRNGYPSGRSKNTHPNEMSERSARSSNIKANNNRAGREYEKRRSEKRGEGFIVRRHSPGRHLSDSALFSRGSDFRENDGSPFNPNKHTDSRYGRHDDDFGNGNRSVEGKYNEEIYNEATGSNRDRERRSRESKRKDVSQSSLFQKSGGRKDNSANRRDKSSGKTLNGRQGSETGRDNLSFQDDEGRQGLLYPDGASRKHIAHESVNSVDGFDRSPKAQDSYVDAEISRDRSVTRSRKKGSGREEDISPVSSKIRVNHDKIVRRGRESRSLSSSHRNHHQHHHHHHHRLTSDSDQDMSKGDPAHREGVEDNDGRHGSRRSKSKDNSSRGKQRDRGELSKSSSKSVSNSNIFEIESDEEKILMMIRKITNEKTRKEVKNPEEPQKLYKQQQQHRPHNYHRHQQQQKQQQHPEELKKLHEQQQEQQKQQNHPNPHHHRHRHQQQKQLHQQHKQQQLPTLADNELKDQDSHIETNTVVEIDDRGLKRERERRKR